MRRLYLIAAYGFLLCALGAIPAHAQIVSYLDDSGKRVYINANPKPVPRGAQPNSAAKTSAAADQSTANSSNPHSSGQTGNQAGDQAGDQTSDANHEAIETMIHEVSGRYQVDPALVRAVIQTESNWNPTAVSTKGALGLMQLVPATAQQMGVNDAFDPKQNLEGGVHYLRMLLERYNGDLDKALAAYNAGPGAVDRAGGVPRYRETRAYVQKVTSAYNQPDQLQLPLARARAQRVPAPKPIYRATSVDGRVIFTNE